MMMQLKNILASHEGPAEFIIPAGTSVNLASLSIRRSSIMLILKEHASLELSDLTFTMPEESFLEIHCAQGARCNLHFVIQQSLRLTITIKLHGEGATATINGRYLLHGAEQCIITTLQYHHGFATQSEIVIKGILSDEAQSTYHGTIHITEQGVSSDAQQSHKAILLSEKARSLASPTIEVLTDNVQCGHASAVGPLDEQQLFLLQARGLERMHAQQLLLDAFIR